MNEDNAITLGVEEELFLVDPETRNLLENPDQKIFETCETQAAHIKWFVSFYGHRSKPTRKYAIR